MPRGGDAQASKTSGSRGSPAVAPPPTHPDPRSPHPSLIGRGERPLGFRQAPGQPPPRPQPGPASSIKAGFNCTNKCLPGSFFFFSNREGQPARIRKFRNVLPSPSPAAPGGRASPQREGHACSWPALQNDPEPPGGPGPHWLWDPGGQAGAGWTHHRVGCRALHHTARGLCGGL